MGLHYGTLRLAPDGSPNSDHRAAWAVVCPTTTIPTPSTLAAVHDNTVKTYITLANLSPDESTRHVTAVYPRSV